MARRGGIASRLLQEAETRLGYTVASTDKLDLLEARSQALGDTRRELDLLGWATLDYLGGNPNEMTPTARRRWAQKAKEVWRQDPLAGAQVDLLNDFVFGRGVPKARAKDEEVQKVIDDFWDDEDNRLVLTSYEAQLALGVDLHLQCNLFLLVFEGKNGKIKLGLLNHDEVETVVRDPENRLRILYYVAAHHKRYWDFKTDQQKVNLQEVPKKVYYEHWRNVEYLKELGDMDPDMVAPEEKIGDGKVYHVALNRTTEEAFGNPAFRRQIRFLSAYNDFISSRIDMAEAAASFIMKRKIKGTPNQVAKMAAKAISRRSELAGASGVGDSLPQAPPHAGSILNENENVEHEALNLNTNAGGAAQDAQTIRASISAAARWPQSFLGDQLASNLATASAMELPVLKFVESRQEVFEQIFRWAIDLAIEKAVEDGKLDKTIKPDTNKLSLEDPNATGAYGPAAFNGDMQQAARLQEYDGEQADEQQTERDLSYDLSMPSPMKRVLNDLTTAVDGIASTFDPNGTNIELSRILLTILFGEGLEMADPAEAVKKVFPDGYEDPMLAAAQQQQQAPPPGGPPSPDAPADPNNPYSAPGQSTDYQANGGQLQQARYDELPEHQRQRREEAVDVTERIFDEELALVSSRLGSYLTTNGHNGHK